MYATTQAETTNVIGVRLKLEIRPLETSIEVAVESRLFQVACLIRCRNKDIVPIDHFSGFPSSAVSRTMSPTHDRGVVDGADPGGATPTFWKRSISPLRHRMSYDGTTARCVVVLPPLFVAASFRSLFFLDWPWHRCAVFISGVTPDHRPSVAHIFTHLDPQFLCNPTNDV